VAYWKACAVRARAGSRSAERSFRRAFDASSRESAGALVSRALAAGVAECLLDRAALRDVRAWLFEHLALVSSDARLRQLLAWTRVCLGDHAGAKSALAGLRPWCGPLPAPLAELRAHRADWLPCLAGRIAESADLRGASHDAHPLRDRAEIGAVVLGVFTLQRDHSAQPILLDVAPALRPLVASWIAEREGAFALPSEREHRLVVSADVVTAHRDGDEPLAGALGRDATRSLALAPILDDDEEVAGWIHVECEHHLLPSAPRLRALACAWRAAILTGSRAVSGTAHARPAKPEGSLQPVDDPLSRAVFDDLVVELGIKTSQRRWWGIAAFGRELRCVAQGGEGAGLDDEPDGRRSALRRALVTGGVVQFDEPDARLAIHAEAASGVVFPLFAGTRICGLLAIESSRRRDFRSADLERYSPVIERAGLALRLAQFRNWHRAEFGFDVWFDAFRADFRTFAQHLLAAARSLAPVVLVGPAGAGKHVLARWLHFESSAAHGPLKVFTCGVEGCRETWPALVDGAAGGSLLLDDVERLPAMQQDAWLGELDGADLARPSASSAVSKGAPNTVSNPTASAVADGGARNARVIATTRAGLTAGSLRSDLARRLDRLQLAVPPLVDRREDILPLVACLSARFAREEGLRPPSFTDDALALLWRQRWDGNVRELENLVYKLVLLNRASRGRAGETLSCEHVALVAGQFHLDLVRRLPSRHPARADLLGALRTTRKLGGRLNKTRAALYLGWDPDTLVARMQEAGLEEANLDADSAWWSETRPGE
jgi:two-component system nitrogen regulation response regulator NtrX